jgi:mRNA interferase YafQ
MRLKLVVANSFKKDLKKYRHKKVVLDELELIVELLINQKVLPPKYKNHFLLGKFRNHTHVQELHLKPDDLLVYFEVKNESINLLAIGSHSDLFS